MPKILNGSSSKANPDHELTIRLLSEYRNLWVEQSNKDGIDPVKFSRLSCVALTQLAAILAVDVGMQTEQFSNICRAQFDGAYKVAPKFG